MKEIQKIVQKVLMLLLDILVFTWLVVRRVILPTRNRKGNLLSSLLTFFIGLLERVASFEKSVLQRPLVFTHRYVKQGLIIAVGFLFLLSSFEWTIGLSSDGAANGSPEVIACASVAGSDQRVTTRRVGFSPVLPLDAGVASQSFIPSLSLTEPSILGKRWLRLRVFRI